MKWIQAPQAHQPCIAVLETTSIASGVDALDRMLKEAPVDPVAAGPVSNGKWLTVVAGEVDEVRSALRAGVAQAGDTVVDSVLIPDVHPEVLPAIRGEARVEQFDAIGLVEAAASPAVVLAADLAVKRAAVHLVDIHLAVGIGGKATLALTGEVSAVQAALAAAAGEIRGRDLLVREVVIPHPDARLREALWPSG